MLKGWTRSLAHVGRALRKGDPPHGVLWVMYVDEASKPRWVRIQGDRFQKRDTIYATPAGVSVEVAVVHLTTEEERAGWAAMLDAAWLDHLALKNGERPTPDAWEIEHGPNTPAIPTRTPRKRRG